MVASSTTPARPRTAFEERYLEEARRICLAAVPDPRYAVDGSNGRIFKVLHAGAGEATAAVRDLVAYLRNPTQVPPPASPVTP